MKFSIQATIASTLLLSTSAFAQGGPPGGPPPTTPASFTASKIGASSPLNDRLLAQTVPGSSTMPASFNGSVPVANSGTITIPASTWSVGYEVYYPATSPTQGIMLTSQGAVFSGAGKTGYWNGTDPGWTVLPYGSQAGGYGQFAMQIVVDLNGFFLRLNATYKYTGTHTFYYGIPGNQTQVGSFPVPWSSSTLQRLGN